MCIMFLDNEHWIGLDKIYLLTNNPSAPMKLRITMEDFTGEIREANYNNFRIEDEVSSLKLCKVPYKALIFFLRLMITV